MQWGACDQPYGTYVTPLTPLSQHNLPSSASLIVFRFWPKMAKYAYFKEPLLTHSNSLKRVQVSRLIRTFCARNNMRAFLSERYLSCNLLSKMTISHSRLAGTKIFQTMKMQENFEMSYLTLKSALILNRKKGFDENLYCLR